MKRYSVESQVLKSVGYDIETKQCEIIFANTGEVYTYEGVSLVDVSYLLFSDSNGSFFMKVFRPKYKNFTKGQRQETRNTLCTFKDPEGGSCMMPEGHTGMHVCARAQEKIEKVPEPPTTKKER